ncbi:MAG: DUF2284 domain-containing protein [Deltaproteobacteria bacterium]|nr:DUF2284 domain-containing protein [Deltaproteobacteria bacterium]
MIEEKALNAIIKKLKESGVSHVVVIPAEDIVIDERVRLKCQVPLCESYNKNLTCPPNVPSVDEFRRVLDRFTRAILVQMSDTLTENRQDAFVLANRLHELINLGETEAFKVGFRFAMGFIGSCCRLCDECAGVIPGEPCRFPFKARPSMSAMGIDVIATATKAGLPVEFPVSDTVTWTGIILL